VQSASPAPLNKNQPDSGAGQGPRQASLPALVEVAGVVMQSGAVDRRRLGEAMSGALAHPAFDDAVAQFAQAVLHCYAHHRVVRRQMHDTARFALLCFLMLQDGEHRAARGAGASVARLVEALSAHGLAARSRVQQLVGGLKLAGGLESLPDPADARARLLRPTAALLDPLRAWLLGDLQAIACVCALPDTPERLCARPQLVASYLGGLARALSIDGFSMLEGQPEIAQLLVRDCGYLVLMELLATSRGESCAGSRADGQVAGGAPLSFVLPVQAFSKRFGVSKSHTRNLLRFGQQCGWWSTSEPGGRATRVSPAFHALLRRWMAQEFVLMAALSAHCFAALGRQAPGAAARPRSHQTRTRSLGSR
jgi:hypothetical protein